jgi:uroporphyrinogen decarboxylase
MDQLSKRERVDAALRGEALDRVPVSAWRHFIPDETEIDSLARTSLKYFREFDWDWLKINPPATYYAEAWGNRYNNRRYDGVYPRLSKGPVRSPADLEKIQEISPTSGVFARQLSLVRQIKSGMGGAHCLQTVFSPLSVLAIIAARPKTFTSDAIVQAQAEAVRRMIRENPQGAHAALHNIAATLAKYAVALVETGASGLFFAIVKLARQGVLTLTEFEEFGRPYDLQVLQAVQGAPFNLLHICGPSVYFDAVLDYPVHAINWAAVGQRNPGLGEAAKRTGLALVGGMDEEGVLQTGTPAEVTQAALAAIQTAGGRKFLLTPGCGTSMYVSPDNLRAMRQAVDLTPPATGDQQAP